MGSGGAQCDQELEIVDNGGEEFFMLLGGHFTIDHFGFLKSPIFMSCFFNRS